MTKKITQLVIAFFLIFFTLASFAKASAEAFLAILNAQNTAEEKSVACFRIWDMYAAAFELALNEKMRKHEQIEGIANSLLQNKHRVFFIKKLSKLKGLEDLEKKSYAAGVGMDIFTDEELKQLLEKDCVYGVNAVMTQDIYSNINDVSLQEAKEYVKKITNNDILQKNQ